jgi:hypothetical protein
MHAAFPPPWSVEEEDACFVRDRGGQKLAYVYFEQAGIKPRQHEAGGGP